jgi:hypothetical protein
MGADIAKVENPKATKPAAGFGYHSTLTCEPVFFLLV